VVDANIDDVNALFYADIDNDGDLDLLSSSGKEDRIAWYKNTDAQGNFGLPIELAPTNSANGAYQVISEDLDGDGDRDIITALESDNRVVWQENLDGQGVFSELKTIGILKS